MDAKQGAENQCQKLKCGQVQWCPQVMAAINKILFWRSVLKWELGGRVGLSVLHKWAQKASLGYVLHPGEYLISTLKDLISQAYKHFCHLKHNDTCHDTWIAQLIAAQAEAWNQTKKALWKKLQSTKQIRQMAYNVCRALQKLIDKWPIMFVGHYKNWWSI